MSGCLVYGANGYTGELIAREAVARGMAPVLAARREAAVRPLAEELGLPWRAFPLDDAAALDRGLDGIRVVIHAAGPFVRTFRPMADACLRAKAHYLDITGEVAVFEPLAARDAEARAAGVMLLPGAGFDVVPSDCLAAHLKTRMPEATSLALGFQSSGRPSRGTTLTMVENVHKGGLVRRGGMLVGVPAAHDTRVIDFGRGPTAAVAIPWGDVSTAFHSTGIPDIVVYMAAPAGLRLFLRSSRYLGWLLGSGPVQGLLASRVRSGPAGPSAEQRERVRSYLWGEVRDARGATAVTRMVTPEGYVLTARTSVAIAARALSGDAPPGFQTPSRAYGADFVLGIDGVTRTDA